MIRISWNWTCCKNLPGSRHYTLGWVPSLDSGKQCHSRIELINFDPRKKKRWTTWNFRLPDKAVATVHTLPCMVLANSGSWRGGKVQVKSDEGYDFEDLANPFTVSVLVLFWIIRANLGQCKERNSLVTHTSSSSPQTSPHKKDPTGQDPLQGNPTFWKWKVQPKKSSLVPPSGRGSHTPHKAQPAKRKN